MRTHLAALRALLVLTAITGIAYPLVVWAVAQLPGLHDRAEGSIVRVDGKPVGSRLIGQSFSDKDGHPLPQYFQSRPSAAGDGYDPLASGASNLGPESIIDADQKSSLLTTICSRSKDIGEREGVDGARPFCTPDGVGAVLSVIPGGRVVSVNQPCPAVPFVSVWAGVRVDCAQPGEDYSAGQLVPVRGAAPADSAVPADAVTASGSGLDPDISPDYAAIQVARVAKARGVDADRVRAVVADVERGRTLGVFGEPRVNVLELNLALDRQVPVRGG